VASLLGCLLVDRRFLSNWSSSGWTRRYPSCYGYARVSAFSACNLAESVKLPRVNGHLLILELVSRHVDMGLDF